MKLEQIVLENFGIYARKQFHFSAAPLVLIYGPNESGKTTALNGIRQALYGFRTRSSYLTPGRAMFAEVSARLQDGQKLEFSRRKGKQDEITANLDSKRLAPEELGKILGEFDLEGYEQLFGFSLDELRTGEAALKHSRLSDALAGGGFGGIAALQQLRSELEQSLAEMYKPRGSTSSINVQLASIAQCQDALRQVQVLPSAVEELREQLANAQQRSGDLKQEYAATFEMNAGAQRLLNALSQYREYNSLQSQLAAIDLPATIDASAAVSWRDLTRQKRELDQHMVEIDERIRVDQRKLEQLGVAAEWFEFEAEIEQIGHQASEISELRGRYSSLQLQLDEATAMISRLLEQLGLTRVTDAVREFSISMPVRRQMETLSNQYAGIESDLRQIDAKLEAANESLTSLPADHYEGPLPQNIPYLNSLLQQLAEYEQQANQLSESVQRRASQAEFVSITKRLTCQPLQLPKLAPGWAVPTTTKIANHLRQQQERQHAIGLLQQRMADIETQLTELKTESEASQLATDVGGSLQRLEQLVEQREQFLARWLDELSEPLLAASITPAVQVARLESLKETLHEMDSVQRSLLDAADFVAEGNQRALRQKVLAADQEDCAQQLEKQQLAVAEHVREWLAMWHACPFQPAHPELMNQWVQDYMRWTELFDELTELRREAHIARGMVREQRLVLQDAWPSILPSDMAFELLKDQIGQWELASRDQIRDQVRRDSMRTTKENLVAKREKLLAERGTLEDQYAAWLQPSPVDQWPIQDLRSLLDCLDRLRREDATAREATNQQASCQEKLGRYESRVERLASQLGFSPPTARHEVTAMQWLEKLQKMRDHRSERIRLQSAIDHHRQLIVELREREQALGGRIEETCKSFGIGDPASVESLMDRVQMAENWRRRLAELSIALDALRGNMSRQEFELQLAAAHETDLLLQTQEWSRQLEQYDEARKLADQQIGALTQQIEQLANNQAAQELLQSVQNQRGALAEMCEQWVVERLAQELLAKSIERFSAEHEPEMLQLTRQFFSQLTGGKYITIEHDPGQSERFYVRNQQEQSFEPGRLSTGTREQLYLAIRMAYITHYCEHHEPLPVVMDDCFVNFDEQRARLVLESIANWRDSLQTILLSCHWRVVQILAEVAPETRVIQLESGRTSSAEELVNEYSLN